MKVTKVAVLVLICLGVRITRCQNNPQGGQERSTDSSDDAGNSRFIIPIPSWLNPFADDKVPYNNYDYAVTYRPYPISMPPKYEKPSYEKPFPSLPPIKVQLPPIISRVVVTVPPYKKYAYPYEYSYNGIPPRPAPPVRINVKPKTTPNPNAESNNDNEN